MSATGRFGEEQVTSHRASANAIGGALVIALRKTAGLKRSGLTRSLGIGTAIVQDWAFGRIPLYSVPYVQLYDLAHAVTSTEVTAAAVLDELLVAGQCDLLAAEMLAGTADYAELPPIGGDCPRGVTSRELLSWAFAGIAPDRYRHVCRRHCLYSRVDRRRWLRSSTSCGVVTAALSWPGTPTCSQLWWPRPAASRWTCLVGISSGSSLVGLFAVRADGWCGGFAA